MSLYLRILSHHKEIIFKEEYISKAIRVIVMTVLWFAQIALNMYNAYKHIETLF